DRLSVFAGGWTLEAAEAVATRGDAGEWLVLDHLAALVGKSLVQADETQGATRYRLLETVRHYAAERLAARPGPELSQTRAGHGGEVLEALNALLERPDAQTPTRARARALTVSCHLLDYFGGDPAPPSMAGEALTIARALADDALAADALAQLCWLSFEHGDLPAA